MVDGRTRPTSSDISLASLIRQSGKKSVLAVNKCDTMTLDDQLLDYHELGMEPILPVSALNGRLTGDLLDTILDVLDIEEQVPLHGSSAGMRMAIVGMPNVGKSSLTNALLQKEQTIVTPIAGTTRDSIDSKLKYYGKTIVKISEDEIKKHKNFIKSELRKNFY